MEAEKKYGAVKESLSHSSKAIPVQESNSKPVQFIISTNDGSVTLRDAIQKAINENSDLPDKNMGNYLCLVDQ